VIAPRTVAAPLLALTTLGFVGWCGVAEAASPAYCALYSREYALDAVQPGAAAGMLQSVQDQAYYRCLNQDEDPPFPTTSAYFGASVAKSTAPSSAASITSVSSPEPKSASQPKTESVAKVTVESQSASVPKTTTQASAAQIVTPSPRPAQAKPPQTNTVVADGNTYRSNYHGSGKAPWTSEWKAWCARNFPNSWDPDTGTILNYGAGRRELCR
jgi:hypothetical protein